jgi:hypothetical protein
MTERWTIHDPRLYTDHEVAIILREAAQAGASSAGHAPASSGLSLEQIKAAAAEAGLDPVLVERTALRIAQRRDESLLERVAGGPRRHREVIRAPTGMSPEVSSRVLSAVRAAAEVRGEGGADAIGFAWHAWYRANKLSVTAHEDSRGTRIQILVDRTPVLVNTVVASLLVVVMAANAMVGSISDLADLLSAVLVPTVVVTTARVYWGSSARAIRDRMAALADAVRESLAPGDEARVGPGPHE